ncbi:ANTAR domain-containing protein [Nocardioides nitrophenolicus]|uniref:ANTAR domain-containing protein n=1 Tax=Nocardioides nitrophenolicus TaxID=60489 RepID=UPI00195BA5FA|nr:ANTAR domain-containing protein [Nocardioides nitrophenolicus]MBM7516375.1 hypothetical protein [Nocardioides nitrophenolicus]
MIFDLAGPGPLCAQTPGQRPGAQPRLAGRFSYVPRRDQWRWDAVAARLHGLEDEPARVTTERLRALVHPSDGGRVDQLVTSLGQERGPFAVGYRVELPRGPQRRILVVVGPRGPAPYAEGFVVDATASLGPEIQRVVSASVAYAVGDTAVVEQAAGALCLAYGFDLGQARTQLARWAEQKAVTVAEVARWIVDALVGGDHARPGLSIVFDALLHDLATETRRAGRLTDPRPGG